MEDQQTQLDGITKEITDASAALAASQADITTLSAGITGLEQNVATLATEVAKLNAVGQSSATPLDLTALTSAAANLVAVAGTLKVDADAAVAKLPAAPPAPEPAPAPTAA